MGVCVCMCLCYTEEIITVAGEHTGDVRKTKGGGGGVRILLSTAKIRAVFTGSNGLCHRHATTVQFSLMTGSHFLCPSIGEKLQKKAFSTKTGHSVKSSPKKNYPCCNVRPKIF